MDSKQMIESILKQINADCIIANHVENDMYIQNFPSRWGGWQVRSPVTWRLTDSWQNPGRQSHITVVAFDVLLRAQPDQEGAFQFPGTNDWVRNQCTSLAIADEELSMPNLYQIIYDRVRAVGQKMASRCTGLVKFDNKTQLDPSLKHVWDEAKLTDSQIRDINNWARGNANETPEEIVQDQPKKVNFREFL